MECPIVAVAKSDNQQNDVKSHDVIGDINKHVVKLVFSIRISVLFFLRENDVGSFEFYNFLFLFLMFAEYFCTSRKIYRAGITVLIIIKK